MDSTESTDDEPPRRRTPTRTRIVPPKAEKKTDSKPPTIRPPDFSEWHNYIGNFAIKWVCRGYIAFVFRGIDRYEILSAQDNQALELDEEQLSDIAKPIAHLADRSKLGKRYGRVLIDSTDGVVAAIQLGMWGARVNRVARKVKEQMGIVHEHGHRNADVSSGETGEELPRSPSGPSFNGSGPGIGYN